MITVVIRMYDKTEKMQSLSYDQSGNILNPVSTVKLNEFHYMNRFIPHFKVMDKAKIEFVDAYEVRDVPGKQSQLIALEPEKVAELKQALTDKLENKVVVEKSALELQNERLMERIERLEARELSRIPMKSADKELKEDEAADAVNDSKDAEPVKKDKRTPRSKQK